VHGPEAKLREEDRCRNLSEAARSRLRRSPHTAVRDMSCQCYQGVLLLRGQLSTFYLKQVAQETVSGLTGVTQVINEIEVVSLSTEVC
jgi:osmotically-inducible protein OsmY